MNKNKKNLAISEAKNLMPKLRFPEFEEEWKNEPLDQIYSFKITNSLSRDKLNYEKGEVKNIHYGDIHTKFSTLFDIEKECVPFINLDNSISKIDDENYCKEGDIIIADASEDLNDIGKSIEIVNLNGQKLLAGLHTFLARRIHKKVEVGFGGYLFKSTNIRKQIKKEAQGSKVLGISKTRISRIDIQYPKNLKEQQKIANCLSSLDEVITAETDKLDLLKDHKKGLLQQLFPAEGETKPKFRFPEFEDDGEWLEKTVDDFCEVFRGRSFSKKDIFEKGKYSCIHYGELFTKYNEVITDVYSKTNKCEGFKSEIGDVLMPSSDVTPDGLAKASTIMLDNVILGGDINIIRPNININSIFLSYLLNHSKSEIIKLVSGTTVKHIYPRQIITCKITVPKDKEEQQKIANCLSAVDELIAAQAKKIEQLQDHKKGLLQQLFPKLNEL